MSRHDLDDREYVLRLDPKGMYDLACAFPEQCRKALKLSRAAKLPALDNEPTSVVLTGLGGSAAGGDFVRALFDAYGHVPFFVNRDYTLPHWVDDRTVVFACSYSGQTEETLSAYADAKAKGAHIIAVTSGGKLSELVQADEYSLIRITGGQPPRTALGFLLVPVLVACERLKLLPSQRHEEAYSLLARCVEEWKLEVPRSKNPTKQLAETLHGKLPVLYGLGSWQGVVAYRWKGQIGENAKSMAFCHSFPELNHNEILGWTKATEQGVKEWVVAVLEDGAESAKMQARARVTADLIEHAAKTHRVQARGVSLLEKMLSLTLFGDFVSLYLAALNGVDPETIDAINTLKSELAQVA